MEPASSRGLAQHQGLVLVVNDGVVLAGAGALQHAGGDFGIQHPAGQVMGPAVIGPKQAVRQ